MCVCVCVCRMHVEVPGDYGSLEEYFRHYRNPRIPSGVIDNHAPNSVSSHTVREILCLFVCLFIWLVMGCALCGRGILTMGRWPGRHTECRVDVVVEPLLVAVVTCCVVVRVCCFPWAVCLNYFNTTSPRSLSYGS